MRSFLVVTLLLAACAPAAVSDHAATRSTTHTAPGLGVIDDEPQPTSTTTTTYANPVYAGDFPDPFVLPIEGGYVAFGTNGPEANVRAALSLDLSSWTELPDALPTLPSWAKPNAFLTWAPSVLQRGSTWVLYFTARDVASGFQCVGRATASDPRGPYSVADGAGPIACQTQLCGSIDASPFVDDDGAAYLVWKSRCRRRILRRRARGSRPSTTRAARPPSASCTAPTASRRSRSPRRSPRSPTSSPSRTARSCRSPSSSSTAPR